MSRRHLTYALLAYAYCQSICLAGPADQATRTAAIKPAAVFPALETVPSGVPRDNADDSAIWIHPADPAKSLIFGTCKNSDSLIFDLSAASPGEPLPVVQTLPFKTGNVDVCYNFPLGGERVALFVAFSKTRRNFMAWKVDETTRQLIDVTGEGKVAAGGTALYVSPVSGKYYYLSNQDGVLSQYEMRGDSGKVDVELVRTTPFGSNKTESVVADHLLKRIYVSEEVGARVWRLEAEPDAGDEKILVDQARKDGGRLTEDTEGLAIYYKSDGTGYLFVSNQGANSYAVYTREGGNDFIGMFEIVDHMGLDGTENTDGIDIVNLPMGPLFPKGFFIAQNGQNMNGDVRENQNFTFVRFEELMEKLGLSADTEFDPRRIGS